MRDVEDLIKKHNELKQTRSTYESQWQEIVENINPRAASFNQTKVPGQKARSKILDSTPGLALRQLAADLVGFFASPTERWVALEPTDFNLSQNEEVMLWLENATNTILHVLRQPNTMFYSSLHSFFKEQCAFGTSVLMLEANDKSIVMFKAISLAECYIEENENMLVDRLHREFKFTPRQILQKFGDTMDNDTKELLQKKNENASSELLEVINIVAERSMYDPDKQDAKNKRFESTYILSLNKSILNESGFNEFPYYCMRWDTKPGEIYGSGPGQEALPDVKVLYKMCETVLRAAEKSVSPPLQAPDDGFIGDIDTRPEAINYYRESFGNEGLIRPIEMGGNVQLGIEMENIRKQQIRDAFYGDLTKDQKANVEQTATEFLGNEESRMRTLAPQAGRAEAELFSPMLERLVNILLDKRIIPVPPKELTEYKFTYISPIARAQRMSQAVQINRMLEQLGQIAQIFPDIITRINEDELTKLLLYLHNTPQKLIRSDKEVEDIRSKREEAIQAQQQVALAEQGSKAVKNVASAQGDLQNVVPQ